MSFNGVRKEQYTVGATALPKNTLVKFASDLIVPATAETDTVLGVVDQAYDANGGNAQVQVSGGPIMCVAGEAFDLGSNVPLRAGSGGRLFNADNAADVICAVADIPVYAADGTLRTCAAGDLVAVSLLVDKSRPVPA